MVDLYNAEVCSEPRETSNMELFAKVVNDF